VDGALRERKSVEDDCCMLLVGAGASAASDNGKGSGEAVVATEHNNDKMMYAAVNIMFAFIFIFWSAALGYKGEERYYF
jgi:hypothetical protein